MRKLGSRIGEVRADGNGAAGCDPFEVVDDGRRVECGVARIPDDEVEREGFAADDRGFCGQPCGCAAAAAPGREISCAVRACAVCCLAFAVCA